MIPPNKGSIPVQDSSLNRTPADNCFRFDYRCPNGIPKSVPEISHTLISVVQISDPEGKKVTRGSLYKFAMWNSSKTGHLGKTLINPNW